jgi:hypothetical protein
LLIQFQDEHKIKKIPIFAQGAKIPGYGSAKVRLTIAGRRSPRLIIARGSADAAEM